VQVDEAVRLVRDLLTEPDRYAYFFERYSCLVMLRILYGKKVTGAEEMMHVQTITNIVHTLERTAAPGAYLVDFLPALKYLPDVLTPFKKEARELHEYEYSYFRGLVAEAENRFHQAPVDPDAPKDLVHAFVASKESWELSDFELAYCLGTLFEGGSGTTSSAMQTFCLAMWHYPEWQTRIQREIDEVVGDRLPTMADWPNLPTVRAAIKEMLRWRPVVPAGIPHVAARDDVYKGFNIPKGAIIHANQFAMVQNPTIYPDPGTYNPDRWLDPKYPTFQAPLTQYPNLKRFTAFGFGRRICPGLVSAERSLFIETTMLMWACSVEKKLDAAGKVIPAHWYDYTAGNNTCPKPFAFELKPRSEKRSGLLRAK
jgi:cytochrome P450